jgi:hypothetical protein
MKAVESSVKTAQYGITLASNFIWLCENLNKDDASDVLMFLDEAATIGNKAIDQAQSTLDAFRNVQESFRRVRIHETKYSSASLIDIHRSSRISKTRQQKVCGRIHFLIDV